MIFYSLLLGLGAAEIALRMAYRKPWYEQLIAGQRSSQAHSYRQNSLGLRDLDYPERKPADTYRILMLGDSFTFGLGVFNDDAIFPRIVQRELNRTSLPSNVNRVEVLNGGIPGSMTIDWVNLLPKVVPQFRPDLVVVVYFLRDGTNTGSIPAFFDEIRSHITESNRESFVYHYSYLFRFLRDQIDRYRVSHQYMRTFDDAYFGNEKQIEEWNRAQTNLRKISGFAHDYGAKTALVVFPILVDLDEAQSYPFKKICELIDGFAQQEAFPTLDLRAAFTGKSAPELWVSAYDQHPNEKAHRIAADAIAPFIRSLLRTP